MIFPSFNTSCAIYSSRSSPQIWRPVGNTRFASVVRGHECDPRTKFNSKMSWPRQENPPTGSYRGTAHDTIRRSLSLSLSLSSQGVGDSHSRFAHVLVRTPVQRPSFHPSTRKANTHLRNVCSHTPVALLPPHVCHRQGTWQSPEARTCSVTFLYPLCSVCDLKSQICRSLSLRMFCFVRSCQRVFHTSLGDVRRRREHS